MSRSGPSGGRGADVLVRDHFCIRAGEMVLITADTGTDPSIVDAIWGAVAALRARPVLLKVPTLPYQGRLADPYVPEILGKAVESCDVWFDVTFPYLAGSHVHDQAMATKRARYLLLGDLDGDGLDRLYGACSLDELFEVQFSLDKVFADSEGAECRISNPAGSNLQFRLGRAATKKSRHIHTPGSSTVMGSAIFYPEPDSVKGELFVDAMFHEFYALLPNPMHLVVDGRIRALHDGGGQSVVAERALRRASGGDFGRIIHFTVGFHPAARFSGASFIEDIRSQGANAVGFGVPWWEPGGGENHPDAVMTAQSVWVDGVQIVRDGSIVHPLGSAEKIAAMTSAA